MADGASQRPGKMNRAGPFGPLLTTGGRSMKADMRTGLTRALRNETLVLAPAGPARRERKVMIHLPAGSREVLSPANRALLKAMRAAELAAWEKSGGDAWIR
jgi:hypothetical protein